MGGESLSIKRELIAAIREILTEASAERKQQQLHLAQPGGSWGFFRTGVKPKVQIKESKGRLGSHGDSLQKISTKIPVSMHQG